MTAWLRRLVARIRYRRFERDLAKEIEFHREMKEQALRSDGVSAEEARHRAMRELGNVMRMREAAREIWIAPWIESIWQDIRYAFRNLRRRPGFTFAASATLVLGIGLSTSLFTVYNAVALRPWPVKNPRTLIQVLPERDPSGRYSPISLAEFSFLHRRASSLVGLAGYLPMGAFLGKQEDAREAVYSVTADFFDVLGVRMAAGRSFVAEDDIAGEPREVAIISYRFWQSRFGGNPDVLGQTIQINKHPFGIVGIAERRFTGPNSRLPIDVYVPLAAHALIRLSEQTEEVQIVGRLGPGASRRKVKAELDALLAGFRASLQLEAGTVLVIGTARSDRPDRSREFRSLTLMLAAMLLVLLIACSNVGNLQLARAFRRHREIGIRLAIGASRLHVVRQLLTESLVLSCGAGAIGVAAAFVLPSVVFRLTAGSYNDPLNTLRPDMRVLGFAAALSILAALVSGLMPALHATAAGRATGFLSRRSTGSSRLRLRSALLAVQIALCVVLLLGAGLLTRGVDRTLNAELDFTTKGVFVIKSQQEEVSGRDLLRSIADTLESTGVASVGVAAVPPLSDNSIAVRVRLPGESDAVWRQAADRPVSNGYFTVLNIPLTAGRWFSEHALEEREAIVNETFARQLWPGGQAVGQIFVDARQGSNFTVIGVVKDCHEAGLGEIPAILHTQEPLNRWSSLLVRGEVEFAPERIRVVLSRVAGSRVTMMPLREYLRESLQLSMIGAGVAWALGLLGLVLAVVGIFGVISYLVEERRREIGIRLALGARRSQVVALILGQTRLATLGGLAIGFALSLGTGQLLRAYLFGISPLDPITHGAVALILFLAAMIAAFIPAGRAARTDPADTLRCE
jgi:predicted permease